MLKAMVALAITLAGAVCLEAAGPQSSPATKSSSPEQVVLNRYCISCHNQKLRTAGLMLDQVNLEDVSNDPPIWEKVVRKLRTGAMPPAGLPRPDKATYDSLAAHLEEQLDRAAAADPNP